MQWIYRYCGCALAVVLLTLSAYAQNLHNAVKDNQVDEVRNVTATDTSAINTTDDEGNTPLHVACQTGSLESARVLIDAGALLNPVNKRGMTPLRSAIGAMHTEIVRLLLDSGAGTDDVHPMFGSVMTYAFCATCQNHGDPALVELLIEHGLTLDAGQVDALGMTPLDWAVHFGNARMAELALNHGADVNLVSQRLGRPPLVGAVSGGYDELVTVLLDHGADASVADQHGNPPIFYAVDKGRTAILQLLLAKGASTEFSEPYYGRGLLHLAAIKGFRDVAETLVDRGAAVDGMDASGKTPLFYALRYGNHSSADYLTAQGAAMPEDSPEDDRAALRLRDNPDTHEASVCYLNHRGWAVATENHSLVFDAEEFGVRRPDDPSLANGFLTTAELDQEDVVALYSCYHGQPGEPAYIHTLADSLDNIAYIHLEDDAWRGSPNTAYLQAYADTVVADVTVQTISIADYMPMLGYMCHVDGLCIYYQAFGTDSPDTLSQRYAFLDQFVDTVDVAFLPLPEPDQEKPDIQLFLERFPTRSVVLLDASRREHMFPTAARRVADWGFQTQVLCAENPGDHFHYQPPRP